MGGEAAVPATMAAAVLKGRRRIEVEDVPVPALGPDDVLVEIDHCGICGSDLHMVMDGWGAPGSVPGHEWTGTVAALGSAAGASGKWRIGDAVIGGPPVRCGQCAPCLAGRASLCSARDTPGTDVERGAMARFKAHPADELLAVPAGMSSRTAALAEPLAVALHGLTLAKVAPGQRAMVFGAGPIGALTIAALRAIGIDDVTCVEPGPQRRSLAIAVGATRVLVPDDLEVPSIAEPGKVVDGAVDVVLECSGNGAAMEAGLAQLVRGGTLVLVGAGMAAPRFDPNRILLNELVLTGAFTYDDDGFERAVALLASGDLPVDALLEPGDVGLGGVLDAMVGLTEGRLAGKVLVKP